MTKAGNVLQEQADREKAWHVRQCLLENLTPLERAALAEWAPEGDNSYWQHCSMLQLESCLGRMRAMLQARANPPKSPEEIRKELFGP